MANDDSDDTRARVARTAATPPPLVLVQPAHMADADTAIALAERLGAPLGAVPDGRRSRATPKERCWTLEVDGARRILMRPDGARLEVDFTAGRTAARQHESGLARQPLARAAGVSRLSKRLGRAPRLVDATGGLGRDAWLLASLGCPVTLIERSALVHTLLDAALERAALEPATAPTARRIELVRGDARACLAELDPAGADVVYLDPMYPPSRRRAAVNKGMQFLHALVGGEGEEGDGEGLLRAALARATAQVTVKRPVAAPPLGGDAEFTGQRSTITSPGTRYDVYLL